MLVLKKKLDRGLSLYASYAESFRIPNIDERVASSSPNTTFDLKPQESEGYDIGVRYFRDKLNLDVSYYLIDTTNEIQYRNGINTNVSCIMGSEHSGLRFPDTVVSLYGVSQTQWLPCMLFVLYFSGARQSEVV